MGSTVSSFMNGRDQRVPGDYPGDDSYLYPYSYNDEPSEREKEINAFISYLNSIARALLKGYEPPEHIDADEDEEETEERVWRLQRRTALPPELVYYIFELAQITSPYPSMTIHYPPPQESTQASSSSSSTTGQTHPPPHAFPNPPLSLLNQWTFPHSLQPQPTHFLHPNANANNSQNPNFVVRSTFGSAARKIWFVSPSLSRMDVRKITRVQLFTVSRDQGWVSNSRDGSWSWWEVGVVRDPGDDVMEGSSSTPSSSSPEQTNAAAAATPTSPTSNQFTLPPEGQGHLSHFNPLASRNLEHCVGKPFNLSHPLLQELQEESEELARLGGASSASQSDEEGENKGKERGVRLAVIGCAHFPGWMCVGSEAKLVIWERFVPDLGVRSD